MNFISNRTQINKLKRVMKRAAIISGKHLMKAYKRKKVNITEKSKKEWVILKLIKNKTNIQTNKLQLSKECNNEIKQHVTS